jgi:coronin-2
MSLKAGYKRPCQKAFKAPVRERKTMVMNGLLESIPPKTENEVKPIDVLLCI